MSRCIINSLAAVLTDGQTLSHVSRIPTTRSIGAGNPAAVGGADSARSQNSRSPLAANANRGNDLRLCVAPSLCSAGGRWNDGTVQPRSEPAAQGAPRRDGQSGGLPTGDSSGCRCGLCSRGIARRAVCLGASSSAAAGRAACPPVSAVRRLVLSVSEKRNPAATHARVTDLLLPCHQMLISRRSRQG